MNEELKKILNSENISPKLMLLIKILFEQRNDKAYAHSFLLGHINITKSYSDMVKELDSELIKKFNESTL